MRQNIHLRGESMKIIEYIEDITCEKRYIDIFVDENAPNWAKYDSELGYVLKTCSMRDGIDDSYTAGTYMLSGERKTIQYAGAPCRINTYGDSFTQCHQVSDGETWQEYLAGHLCEPVRNFGVGGYGVWQAYKRMLRHEANPDQSAESIIFNIFSDDHMRSIDRWRWIRIGAFRKEIKEVTPHYFHATPWTYLRLNPFTLQFEPHESLCPKKEDLYRLCDKEFLYEEFKDDLIVHLEQAKEGGEFNPKILRDTADMLGLQIDLSDGENAAASAVQIHNVYSLRSTEYIIEQMNRFCSEKGKKLLLVLSYGAPEMAAGLLGQPRFDQQLLDYIQERNYCLVDLVAAHKREFDTYRLDVTEYIKKYYINGFGHYNPSGNHFCAYTVKNDVVDMLDPKPAPYVNSDMVGAATLASRLA